MGFSQKSQFLNFLSVTFLLNPLVACLSRYLLTNTKPINHVNPIVMNEKNFNFLRATETKLFSLISCNLAQVVPGTPWTYILKSFGLNCSNWVIYFINKYMSIKIPIDQFDTKPISSNVMWTLTIWDPTIFPIVMNGGISCLLMVINQNRMDLVSTQDKLVHSFTAQLPLPCILNSQRTSGSLDPFLVLWPEGP